MESPVAVPCASSGSLVTRSISESGGNGHAVPTAGRPPLPIQQLAPSFIRSPRTESRAKTPSSPAVQYSALTFFFIQSFPLSYYILYKDARLLLQERQDCRA